MSECLAVIVPVYNEPQIRVTLDALYGQSRREGTHHYIVDNASTDDTRARIEAFAHDRDDFPLTVLTEEQKGTGAAADTGFRRAVEDGNRILTRTDGDSVPMSAWTERIADTFEIDPGVRLLGGRMTALRDEQFRPGDDQLLVTAVMGARALLALRHFDLDYFKAVTGANMATTSDAYEQVGGIVRSSIDELDEDIDYSLKVARAFGRSAIHLDSQLRVATSMRRIRRSGIVGTAIHHLLPGRRKKHGTRIDIRTE